MPFRYKIDILSSLRNVGYTSYKVRQEHLFSEDTMQAFRSGKIASRKALEKLCKVLNCQPGDILEYVDK